MPINWDQFRTGGAYGGALARSLLPDAIPAALASGQRVGPYVIERELGRGGMAIVYIATREDGEFAQRVALKWMAPTAAEPALEVMFRRERDILASLDHPGIARLLDGGRTPEGMLWFAMELVDGEPIDRWCATRALDRTGYIRLVLALCDALAYAHGRLLIHRDIKPANVMVDASGRVRLLDFGIARLVDQVDLHGHHALTPGYASPEQLRGEPGTVASDIYQVGLLLTMLMADRRETEAARHTAATDAVVPAAVPAAPTDLPPDIAAILARATAQDPERRFPTISALADDLRRWLDRRPVQAYAGGWTYALACLLRRQPLASAASAFALLALVGGLVVANLARIDAREAEQRARAAQRTAQETSDFLLSIFRAPDPRAHPGLDLTARELLARGVVRIDELDREPAVQATMIETLAEVSLRLGDDATAASLLDRAIAVHDSGQLPDNPAFAAVLARAAAVRRVQGDNDSSIAAATRALAILDVTGTEQGVLASEIHNELGLTHARLHQPDAAMRHYREALSIRERLGLPQEASILLNIGTLELNRGDSKAALAALAAAERALPIDLPPNHPTRSTLYTNLAGAARMDGRLGLAIAYGRRADAIDRASLGADHVDRGPTLQGLGITWSRLGRRDLAEPLLREALAVTIGALGPGHPRSAAPRRALASLLLDLGEIDEARTLAQAALDALGSGDDPATRRARAIGFGLLAEIERRAGDLAAARAAITQAGAAVGEGPSVDRAAALARHALIELDAGAADAARMLWQQAEAMAPCAGGDCPLDSPDRHLLRAQWLARSGADAWASLDAALANPRWNAGMLELPGLASLHGDPRWSVLRTRLAVRVAKEQADADGVP